MKIRSELPSEHLLAYYWGTIDDSTRIEVETRLLESKSALVNFIALKRSFELKDHPGIVPSSVLKRKLAQDIQNNFGKSPAVIFRRPINRERWRYAGIVAAALLVVVGGLVRFYRPPIQISESPPLNGISVDATGDLAANLNVL